MQIHNDESAPILYEAPTTPHHTVFPESALMPPVQFPAKNQLLNIPLNIPSVSRFVIFR